MSDDNKAGNEYIQVSAIDVEAVRPERSGFVMQGRGADRAEYRVEMDVDFPVDQQTKAVIGEILAQSALRVFRRAPASVRRPTGLRSRKEAGS